MKKWIAMLLCLLMLVSVFAGCSAKQESSEPQQTTGEDAQTADTKEEAAEQTNTDEPKEIVNLVCQICTLTEPGEGFYRMEDALNEMLERDIGVHVTFERTDVMQTTTDATLAISTGEQMDVIISFGTGALTWESGLCIPLDDLCAEYGRDIIEQCGIVMEQCKIDGQLVGVTVMGVNADGYGYQMKKSIADKYGFTRNTDKLYTFEDMEQMFQTIADGEGNMLMQVSTAAGSDALKSVLAWDSFGATYPTYGALILGNDNYDRTKVVNLYATEEYAYYCQKMYEWAQKGWISADAAVTTDSADEICARDDVRIHPLVARQQNIIRVKMRPVFRPALDGVQMRQRLDAGHDRHTALVGICVQFTQFGLRVASAHIAEVRLVRYLIGVFCV